MDQPQQPVAHVHIFEPVPLRVGRYACACGEQAYRDLRSGAFRITKRRYATEPAVTAAHRDWIEEDPYGRPLRSEGERWQSTEPEAEITRKRTKQGRIKVRCRRSR